MTTPEITLSRLEDQIAWYDGRSQSCQRWYKSITLVELVAAASIPLLAGLQVAPWWIGGVGVVLVVLGGAQSLNQFQHNWIIYRSTCEELRHEKYLWSAKAGPYAASGDPDRLLAERIESLISQEHARWVAGRKRAAQDVERLRRPEDAAGT